VRDIYRRYAILKSVRALKEELDFEGVVSKARLDRFGRQSGGKSLARGALYLMLQNRIYRGEIIHRDNCYPSLHDAIVDAALWDEVQAALAENRVERVSRFGATAPSLLAGLVYDDGGEPMSPTHANKHGTRYRYYVSQSLIQRGRPKAAGSACRVPAADLEAIVEDRICAFLRDQAAIFNAAGAGSVNIAMRKTLTEQAAALARRWPTVTPADKRMFLHVLVARVDVRPEAVDSAIRPAALPALVGPEVNLAGLATAVMADGPTQLLSIPAQVRRTGMQMKLLIQGAASTAGREPDRSLLRLIGQAHRFHEMVMNGQSGDPSSAGRKTITELASEAGVSPSYFTRIFRLSFLAPEISKTILHGGQPTTLKAKNLLLHGQLALAWSQQRAQLGLA